MVFKANRRIIQLLVSAILLVGLCFFVELEETRQAWVNANVYYLVVAVILVILGRILMAVKWNLLLRAKNIYVSWCEVTRVYYISSFLGVYLPPTIGADVVRAYYVARTKGPLRHIVSSILVERLLGLIAVLMFAVGGAILLLTLFANSESNIYRLLGAVLIMMAVVMIGFFASLSASVSSIIMSLIRRLERKNRVGKVAQKANNLYESYLLFRTRKGILAGFFLLTCLEVCFPVLWCYIVSLGLGLTIPLLYFLAFVPTIIVLVRLPISLDGFGIQEGGFVYFLALVGAPTSLGLSVGLISHLAVLVGLLPGALFYALDRKRKEIVAVAENAPHRDG
jgi:uncharacterized protein (TIRG00374 family)